jgi:hypothetical protein
MIGRSGSIKDTSTTSSSISNCALDTGLFAASRQETTAPWRVRGKGKDVPSTFTLHFQKGNRAAFEPHRSGGSARDRLPLKLWLTSPLVLKIDRHDRQPTFDAIPEFQPAFCVSWRVSRDTCDPQVAVTSQRQVRCADAVLRATPSGSCERGAVSRCRLNLYR